MDKRILAIALLFVVAACEQETQTLPFDVEASTTSTVGSSGGTVSTAAGASVNFDSGSLGGSTQVSITPTDAPAALAIAGSPVSRGFKIEPAGQTLANPATVTLRYNNSSDASRLWLASVVNVVGTEVTPFPHAHVDLANKTVASQVTKLGTMSVVIPASSQIIPIQTASAAAAPSAAASVLAANRLSADCGLARKPCSGITVTATKNLLDQAQEAAILYPSAGGSISIFGGTASGQVVLVAPLRYLLQSGQTAETLYFAATITPKGNSLVTETATQISISNVEFAVYGGSADSGLTSRETRALVLQKSGNVATFNVERAFQIRTKGGVLETARIAVTLPLTIEG